MKKFLAFYALLGALFITFTANAADEPAANANTQNDSTATTPLPPKEETAPAAPVAEEDADIAAENLEFVSGEVTAVDEAAKKITVKVYGETEDAAAAKTLVVNVDNDTDITDGEKDRDLKSLTAGTEVDVEYDPATSKATYIFVY